MIVVIHKVFIFLKFSSMYLFVQSQVLFEYKGVVGMQDTCRIAILPGPNIVFFLRTDNESEVELKLVEERAD
jgi:hypothetical protein